MAEFQCTQEEMERRAIAEVERRSRHHDINEMMAVSYCACSADERTLELCHQVAGWEVNVMGSMHGGLFTFLLDATMAIVSRAYTGDEITPTMDIHVSFLRPVRQGDVAHMKARIDYVGRHMIHLTAELRTEQSGQLCASAAANFYRVAPPGSSSAHR